MDGSDKTNLANGLSPAGIALDVANGHIFWTDTGTDKIHRANLDGTDKIDFITGGLSDPFGLSLDLINEHIYWSNSGPDKIQRANLDGTNVIDLVNSSSPSGIALQVQSTPDVPEPKTSILLLLTLCAAGIMHMKSCKHKRGKMGKEFRKS